MFTETAMMFVASQRYAGELASATHQGTAGGDGPYLTIWLRIESGVIREARYATYGCPSAIACGGALCQLVTGRTVEKAKLLAENDLLLFLGGLPEGKSDTCPQLAIGALRSAIGED